jgi:hypothetical protein
MESYELALVYHKVAMSLRLQGAGEEVVDLR